MSPVAAHAEVKLNADGLVSGGTKVEGEVQEIGDVIVQVFINKSGLGTAMVKVSLMCDYLGTRLTLRPVSYPAGEYMILSGKAFPLLTSCSPVS